MARELFAQISGEQGKTGIALPLTSHEALSGALQALYLYKGKSCAKKCVIKAAQAAHSAHLLKPFLRRRFHAEENKEETLINYLQRHVPEAREELTYSIYIPERKFLFPIIGKKSGTIYAYAKAYLPGSADYGKNEAATLKKLETVNIPPFHFPKIIHEGYFKKYYTVILSTFDNPKNISGIRATHINFLKSLGKATGQKLPFKSSPFASQMGESLAYIKSKIPEKYPIVEEIFQSTVRCLQDRSFTFSLTMREFPYFQMLKTGKGFFIIDWELARAEYPAIFDVFSLLMSEPKYRSGEYSELYRKNIEHILSPQNKAAQQHIKELCTPLDIKEEDLKRFFTLYLIDQLYIHLQGGAKDSARRITDFFAYRKKEDSVN